MLLIFSQAYCIVAVFVLGYLFAQRRRVFAHALIVLLISLLVNRYLKHFFHIPLQPPLKGYAFPSGHMQATVVFYGYLAHAYKKYLIASFIFASVGCGLVYHHYHTITDVIGALFVGLFLLVLYEYCRNYCWPDSKR